MALILAYLCLPLICLIQGNIGRGRYDPNIPMVEFTWLLRRQLALPSRPPPPSSTALLASLCKHFCCVINRLSEKICLPYINFTQKCSSKSGGKSAMVSY